MNALEWELNWIDNNPDRYEGPLHREAVKRFITERYEQKGLIKGDVVYLKKGMVYKYLGQSLGAGWRRDERLFVYWDADKNQLFHRERDDFNEAMKL